MAGLATNDDDLVTVNNRKNSCEIQTSDKSNAEIMDSEYNTNDVKDEIPSDVPDCVLKSKSVFRCKLCPRIVCLTEETLRAHLESKVNMNFQFIFVLFFPFHLKPDYASKPFSWIFGHHNLLLSINSWLYVYSCIIFTCSLVKFVV